MFTIYQKILSCLLQMLAINPRGQMQYSTSEIASDFGCFANVGFYLT